MFALFSIDRRHNNLMIDHVLLELKLSDFSLPAYKWSKIFIIDEEVKDSLGFWQVNQLRDFSPYDSLEIRVVFAFNRRANWPDERIGIDNVDFF